MFPDFHYLFQQLFGLDIPGLSIIKTFGFFVALGFLAGAWVIAKELKRKKEEGLFEPEIVTEVIGKKVTTQALVTTGVLGFLVGFKLVGLFIDARSAAQNPIDYILSGQGSWLAGIILAALFVYSRYRSAKRQELPQPKEVKRAVYPHNRVTDIIFIAAIAGFAGAKLFNAFETWDDFIQDPIGNLLAPAGLTYYGGLILATVCLYIYSKKKKFSFAQLCDATAPALILAYGIGRLGCQFSGDGDWGVFNSAYITQADASLAKSSLQDYDSLVRLHPELFIDRNHNATIPNIYAPAPGWAPDWLYAQNFKHNVNNDGMPIAGATGDYTHVLPAGVFPTSMYEAIVCFGLFLILWGLRKRFRRPLKLFGVYLVMNGLERFFIEKVRVNFKYDWGFIHPTQAEIISFLLVVAGLGLFFFYKPKTRKPVEGGVAH